MSMELSSIFMVFKWMLETSDMKKHVLFKINGILFTIVFFLVRILPIPIALSVFYLSPAPTDTTHVISNLRRTQVEASSWLEICKYVSYFVLVPQFLNLFWFYKLVRMIQRLVAPKKKD